MAFISKLKPIKSDINGENDLRLRVNNARYDSFSFVIMTLLHETLMEILILHNAQITRLQLELHIS